MVNLHFSINIEAPVAKVWDIMLQKDTYEQWTAAFHPGSTYKGDWSEGSKMLFVDTEGSGGMVSRVAANRPQEFISIEHQGIVKDGVEDTTSSEATEWAPAHENYTFKALADNQTELMVDSQIPDEFEEEFTQMWQKGLQSIKELAET